MYGDLPPHSNVALRPISGNLRCIRGKYEFTKAKKERGGLLERTTARLLEHFTQKGGYQATEATTEHVQEGIQVGAATHIDSTQSNLGLRHLHNPAQVPVIVP
jgi:hypothetical protein